MTASVAMGVADASIEVVGGAHRIGILGETICLRVTARGPAADGEQVTARLTVEDIFGSRVQEGWPEVVSLESEGGTAICDLRVSPTVGYYRVAVEITSSTGRAEAATDLGIVRAPHPGVRPDSFFSSNTAVLLRGEDLALLRNVGVKVQRAHFQPAPIDAPPQSDGAALALDFSDQDEAWREAKAAGTWVLPIVGYSFPGTNADLADQVGMHGPPRNADEFVATWRAILERYREVTTWEFWNEPWIFGWAWADTGEAYRRLQQRWCEMALGVDPRYRLIAGSSAMFTEDHIEIDPGCWQGLLSGTTHHPYTYSVSTPSLRAGDQGRSVDHGRLVTRRMGLPLYYLTEGGTWYQEPEETTPLDSMAVNNNANARKLVQYYVRAALVGSYMGNAQWGIGYGPGWTRGNVALAVMSQMLEDRPIVADVWPAHELVWGAIFANPACVNDAVRALPRAEELTDRWTVPVPADRGNDATKVAVIWATTGPTAEQIDETGSLTVDAAGLQAFDMTGRTIPAVEGRLVLPLGENPVYVTTDVFDVVSFHEVLATGRMEGLTALNLYPISLLRPADEAQDLRIRVENQLNRSVGGRMQVAMLDASVDGEHVGSVDFTVASGALVEVAVPWPGRPHAVNNQYGVLITADTDAGSTRAEHIISAARFTRRTPSIDGTSVGWEGSTPVVLDSDATTSTVDLTRYMLNPQLERPTETAGGARVVARVHTAFDDANVYIRAEISENSFSCSIGEPVVKASRLGGEAVELPYRTGVPDGLSHPLFCGDAFAFAFGFRDRVPGWGRQMDDPYAWKGHFYDTDHQYIVHASTDGPMLVRQWAAGTTRRGAYQAAEVPGCGTVPGAQVSLVRHEDLKLTIYEVAIPRVELALFEPSRHECRFSFVVYSDEPLADGTSSLEWSTTCGVFDHWRSSGSFSPSYAFVLPCQTSFGIESAEVDGARG